MADTDRDEAEHERLVERTAELQQEHADLALSEVPFNQADHHEHAEKLRRHKTDLAAHKERLDDGAEPSE